MQSVAPVERPRVEIVIPHGPQDEPHSIILWGFDKAQAVAELRNVCSRPVGWAEQVTGLGLAVIGYTEIGFHRRVLAVIREGLTEADINTELRRQYEAERQQAAAQAKAQ